MIFIDYYKTLGIKKNADAREIKNAYRKLARKYHPDLNPNNKDASRLFQQINEANSVLSDPEKRKKYDKYGKDWQHADEFRDAGPSQKRSAGNYNAGFQESGSEGDFSEFFESMFGGSGKSRQVRFRGENLIAEMHLGLTDVCETHSQTLSVNGRAIRIKIPAGIENKQTIKISGYGGQGVNGGPNGDLLITFIIEDHPDIKRLGNDLFTTINIDLYTAVLGGDIIVETLTGKVKIKVKPGTQNNSRIKLRRKGLPAYKNENIMGDLYITLSVILPVSLTPNQKKLFTELSKLSS